MRRNGIGARSEPAQWLVQTNGIHLNVAEQGEGPLVLLCPGFPESWYSWRHHPPQFTKPQPTSASRHELRRRPPTHQAHCPFPAYLVCPP